MAMGLGYSKTDGPRMHCSTAEPVKHCIVALEMANSFQLLQQRFHGLTYLGNCFVPHLVFQAYKHKYIYFFTYYRKFYEEGAIALFLSIYRSSEGLFYGAEGLSGGKFIGIPFKEMYWLETDLRMYINTQIECFFPPVDQVWPHSKRSTPGMSGLLMLHLCSKAWVVGSEAMLIEWMSLWSFITVLGLQGLLWLLGVQCSLDIIPGPWQNNTVCVLVYLSQRTDKAFRIFQKGNLPPRFSALCLRW